MLSELTYGKVQSEVINRLQDQGKSYSTLKNANNTLNECIKYVIFPKGLIVKSPMMGVSRPSPQQFDTKEIRYFNDDEIARFKVDALAAGKTGKSIYLLGYGRILVRNTGVRVGEALAWFNANRMFRRINYGKSKRGILQ